MAESEHLDELLLDWQEAYHRGRDVPAADLCRDCPDLAAELDVRIAAVRHMGRLAAEVRAAGAAVGATQPYQAAVGTNSGGETGVEGGPPAAGPDDPAVWVRSLAPPQAPGELGRLGQFSVRRVLGQGGMGAVFAAEDLLLKKVRAVKLMRPHLAATADARDRFLREARSAAKLEHERVVPIHHVGEAGGVPYLVMPLLEGESLEARLKREPRPPLAEVVRIGREMAEGLAAAHAAGVVHRDVKPANVWLKAPGGSAVLLDFGLARAAESGDGLTQSGSVVGTPAYMAPEQADGQAVDHRADLFSLGVVLYQLATGASPFAGPSVLSILNRIATHHPPAPREVRADVPADLSDLVLRLLAKDPAGRPASAREVVEALQAIETAPDGPTAPRPVQAPAPAGQRPAGPSSGRRRWLVGGAVCAACLVVALAVRRPWSGPPVVADDSARPPSNAAVAAAPLRVVSLDVHHFARLAGESGQSKGVLGRTSFGAAVGDQVTVQATLSRPAYAYLLAFRPDGQTELIFPEDEGEAPPLTDRPCYPSRSREQVYGLAEGAGLWVFAVAASEKPLPPYRAWSAGRAAPWKQESAPAGVVWIDDGQWVEALSPAGVDRGERAKGAEVPGRSAVVRVADWLKAGLPADAVGTVGVAVTERK
jgi:tRNA A-37 threonylcarbamoyl transferase component Bud32